MSLRLDLVNLFCRYVLRPRIARTPSPARARRDLDRAARFLFRRTPFTCHTRDGDLHWISVGRPVPRKLILYIHGGAYIAGSPDTHAAMIARISALSGLRVAAPVYPLAPEAPAPAAFDAACRIFDRLMEMGYAPSDIVLGADSAGGGLALALLALLCADGRRSAGLFTFSAWTDLGTTGASITENAGLDRLLDPARLPELVDYVTASGAFNPLDPRLSPLYAEWRDPPPVLMQVAGTEILRDDTMRMAEILRAAGGTVTVSVEPDAPHVWQLLDGWVPESRASLADAAAFARDCLTRPSRAEAES